MELAQNHIVTQWALKSKPICYIYSISTLYNFYFDIIWKLLTCWIFGLIEELFCQTLLKISYKCCLETKGTSVPVNQEAVTMLLIPELCFLCSDVKGDLYLSVSHFTQFEFKFYVILAWRNQLKSRNSVARQSENVLSFPVSAVKRKAHLNGVIVCSGTLTSHTWSFFHKVQNLVVKLRVTYVEH